MLSIAFLFKVTVVSCHVGAEIKPESPGRTASTLNYLNHLSDPGLLFLNNKKVEGGR